MRQWGWLAFAVLLACIAYIRQTYLIDRSDDISSEMIASSLKNVVVVGGSYVGLVSLLLCTFFQKGAVS
jgi:hypothetical protein